MVEGEKEVELKLRSYTGRMRNIHDVRNFDIEIGIFVKVF